MPGHGLLVGPPLRAAKPLNLLKSLEKAIEKLFTNHVMINGWLLGYGPFIFSTKPHHPKSTTLDPEDTK
jgi:hypothetical protein